MQVTVSVADEPAVMAPIVIPEPLINALFVIGPAGQPVPEWVRTALPDLPKTLSGSAQRAHTYERAVADLIEAGVLADRVGQTFAGTVTSAEEKEPTRGVLMAGEVGVEAPITSTTPLPVGQDVRARLVTADIAQRKVEFSLDPA